VKIYTFAGPCPWDFLSFSLNVILMINTN
jgi:hypothetical protein